MSVSMWSYRPEVCDGGGCPGDCDLCDKPKNMEEEDDMTDYIKREDARHYINIASAGMNDVQKVVIKAMHYIDSVAPADVVPKSIYEQTKWERDFAEKRADDMSKLIRNKDVVEVVRCKDCKYHDEFSSKCNKLHLTPMRPNYFCSFGERRE